MTHIQSDIFSLGVRLWGISSGKVPCEELMVLLSLDSLEIEPNDAYALKLIRGAVYRHLKQHNNSLKDFDKSLENDAYTH